MFSDIHTKIQSFMPTGGEHIDHIYLNTVKNGRKKELVKVIYKFKGELRTFTMSSTIGNTKR